MLYFNVFDFFTNLFVYYNIGRQLDVIRFHLTHFLKLLIGLKVLFHG